MVTTLIAFCEGGETPAKCQRESEGFLWPARSYKICVGNGEGTKGTLQKPCTTAHCKTNAEEAVFLSNLFS